MGVNELKFPDPYWAVFNQHVNDAERRAMKVCEAAVGKDTELPEFKKLKRAQKAGIMAIFEDEHKNWLTTLYKDAVFIFANGLDKEGE